MYENAALHSALIIEPVFYQPLSADALWLLHKFLEALHIPFGAQNVICFHGWPNKFHDQCLEFEFDFHSPKCLIVINDNKGVLDTVDGKFIFINNVKAV